MKAAKLPEDEAERLDALRSLNIIYSPAEERFDRITRIAKRLFDVPIVLVSLVSDQIQWFKSCQGLAASETSREVSFCSHALLIDEPLIVNDTLSNPVFSDNPLVTGEPHIRFYAGSTIKFNQKKIGTLCLIDTQPRTFTRTDIDSLLSLTKWVENELKNVNYDQVVDELLSKNSESRRKTLIDPVTGTWNQKGMEKILQKTFAEQNTQQNNKAIMKIVLDGDKEDEQAQLEPDSDLVLKETAQRIRSSLLEKDEMAIYRDKEFLLLLNDCNVAEARSTAQNILRNISVEPFQFGDQLIMATASIGFACTETLKEVDWRELVTIAESALYDAQVDGGNQSILAQQEA